MKIFRTKEVALIDAYTIEHEPISSVDLMERAAKAVFQWIFQRYGTNQNFKIFVGPGNNGGDALAVARMLASKGFSVELYLVIIGCQLSNDCKINLERLMSQNRVRYFEINSKKDVPWIFPDDVVVDGIFGSGLSRPLEGVVADVVKSINASSAKVVSVDIPSGMFGEKNIGNNPKHIVHADITLSLQFPKLSFLFAENQSFVGNWELLPIGLHPSIIEQKQTPYQLLSLDYVCKMVKSRNKFDHKGIFGHGLLIAGSYGKMGAAILASRAALRSGIGLLTAHIPVLGYNIMQISVPEAMVSVDSAQKSFTSVPELSCYKSIGIGPGLGTEVTSCNGLEDIMDRASVPMIFDADAINILGKYPHLKEKIPQGSVFTPHPKEFERLVGAATNDFDRNQMQRDFAQKYGVTVILKGAYSCVATADGSCFFNSTGNPGMATGGSGDVLTGIILSLLAQGYLSHEAAIIGVYLHGLSGDLAVADMGQEALTAGDIVAYLGNAWKELRK